MELFKYASVTAKSRFLNILNICWTTYQIPDDWKKAIIIPIFKKGNGTDCNNYKGNKYVKFCIQNLRKNYK
jgi:hypothetical protein